jgi:hypothetical protein
VCEHGHTCPGTSAGTYWGTGEKMYEEVKIANHNRCPWEGNAPAMPSCIVVISYQRMGRVLKMLPRAPSAPSTEIGSSSSMTEELKA